MSLRAKVCEAIGVLSTLSVLACGQATSVTSPSPTAASIRSIVVTGPTASGANFQLSASAKATDGTTQDVTALARWDASDPSKISISSTGWVTILALGTVDVRATYQNVTGSMQVRVAPPPPDKYFVTGVVREDQPTSHPIAGATVRITTGPDIGAHAVSDANGLYMITGLSPGFAAVETTASGYSVDSVGITIQSNTTVDLWLAPTPPKDATGANATARCNDGTWSWALTRAEACPAAGGIAYPVCPGTLCPDGARKTR